MANFAETVAASNATADIAFIVCVVSFFIAGGVAIYLLWDKIHESKMRRASKARVVKPRAKTTSGKKTAVRKKTTAKKPVRKTTKKK